MSVLTQQFCSKQLHKLLGNQKEAREDLSLSAIQSFNRDKLRATLLSSEKATELTPLKWPSSVCSAAPVTASQSRTVLSYDLHCKVSIPP